ncbi:MAG: hypothetical protein ACI9GO_000330 [Bacteroidia bacterium]|jgi:hypothetical protein
MKLVLFIILCLGCVSGFCQKPPRLLLTHSNGLVYSIRSDRNMKIKTADIVYKNPDIINSYGFIFEQDSIAYSEAIWVKCYPRLKRISAISCLSLFALNAPILEDTPFLWYKVQPGDRIWLVRLGQGIILTTYAMIIRGVIHAVPKNTRTTKWSYSLGRDF